LRIACRHLNARVRILMDRRRCGWQVDGKSEGFRVVSLFVVSPLSRHRSHSTLRCWLLPKVIL